MVAYTFGRATKLASMEAMHSAYTGIINQVDLCSYLELNDAVIEEKWT
jgi:hypothetical protein